MKKITQFLERWEPDFKDFLNKCDRIRNFLLPADSQLLNFLILNFFEFFLDCFGKTFLWATTKHLLETW